VYVLAVGPAAYGAGKVVAGAQDWGALVAGLAITAGCVVLGPGTIAAQDPRVPRGANAAEASGESQ